MSLILLPIQLNHEERIRDISNQYRILVSNETSCRVLDVPELKNYVVYMQAMIHTAIDKELSIFPRVLTSLVAGYVNTDIVSPNNPASFFSQRRVEVTAKKPGFITEFVGDSNGKCCSVM